MSFALDEDQHDDPDQAAGPREQHRQQHAEGRPEQDVAAAAEGGRAELSGPAVTATARAAAPRAMPPTRVVGIIQGFMHVGRPCDGAWFPFARRFADAPSRHAARLAHARQGGR